MDISWRSETDLRQSSLLRRNHLEAKIRSMTERGKFQMNCLKEDAIKVVDQLYEENRLDSADYSTIRDALDDIELLRDRDEALEELWSQFSDIPMDPETECIEAPFLGWGAGISREEIWHWFDQRHSKGVAYLLYGGAEDYVLESRRLYGLKKFCTESDAEGCVFNPNGVCLAPFVTGQAPRLHDEGCVDFCHKECDV